MEAQDSKKLAVRKAISAHEDAAATLADLINEYSDPAFQEMLERITANLRDLRSAAEVGAPKDV